MYSGKPFEGKRNAGTLAKLAGNDMQLHQKEMFTHECEGHHTVPCGGALPRCSASLLSAESLGHLLVFVLFSPVSAIIIAIAVCEQS